MAALLIDILVIAVGIFMVGSGLFQVRTALRTGVFFGVARVEYREERNSSAFWINLIFRSLTIPIGILIVCLAIIRILK